MPKTDEYNWAEVLDALKKLPESITDQLKDSFPDKVQATQSAPYYDSRQIMLPAEEAIELFPYDATRVRFYLRATPDPSGSVQMGNRDQIAAGLAWEVSTAAQTEFHTVERVFVRAIGGPAILFLWAEYEPNA